MYVLFVQKKLHVIENVPSFHFPSFLFFWIVELVYIYYLYVTLCEFFLLLCPWWKCVKRAKNTPTNKKENKFEWTGNGTYKSNRDVKELKKNEARGGELNRKVLKLRLKYYVLPISNIHSSIWHKFLLKTAEIVSIMVAIAFFYHWRAFSEYLIHYFRWILCRKHPPFFILTLSFSQSNNYYFPIFLQLFQILRHNHTMAIIHFIVIFIFIFIFISKHIEWKKSKVNSQISPIKETELNSKEFLSQAKIKTTSLNLNVRVENCRTASFLIQYMLWLKSQFISIKLY